MFRENCSTNFLAQTYPIYAFRVKLYYKGEFPAELLNRVESELNQFIGEAEPFDDIVLLAIKRKQ